MSALTDNQSIFKKFTIKYGELLENKTAFNDDDSETGFYSFMKYFKEWLYESIHNLLTKNKYEKSFEKTIRIYCNYIKEKILPVCFAKIKYYRQKKKFNWHIYLSKWLDLEDDFYALACYRNLKMTALYLDRDKNDGLWKKTIHLFENFFDYCQRLVFGEKIETIRASYFPGAGKTFGANILCAWWFGIDEEMSILRITYSDDLCAIFIRQIAEIINSKRFRKIFPKFDKGDKAGNNELYKKYSVDVGFQFEFSSVMNFYASTRDGQTTGKRGKVLIIDDLTKGADEAFDEKLHKRMENKFDTEWCSRADTSYQPLIALGTMWSNLDLLNVIYNRAVKDTDNNIEIDTTYKYTEIGRYKDGSIQSVFISTPILDYYTDESTCPLRYSTESMRKKRGHMEEALWNAVYQQRPTPPSDFIFSINNLETYDDDNYPKELKNINSPNYQCYAFIDPTRTGKDFFAMGIFKRYRDKDYNWSKWYLTDCIFEQLPTKELMFDIVSKVMTHNITNIGFENNVDASFDDNLQYKLRDVGYNKYVNIDSFFSYGESKDLKILNASSGIKKEIVYPSIKLYSLKSPMGQGMKQFTTWSRGQKYGDHDDFPDMIAMFVKYYCETELDNEMEVLPSNYRI